MGDNFTRLDLYVAPSNLVNAAKFKRHDDIKKWNSAFSYISREVFRNPITPEDLNYANCRSIALLELAYNFECEDRQKFYKALDEQFYKIPVPSLLD